MSDQAQFGVAVVAHDKTAAGVKKAEKSLGLIPKKVGEISKRSLKESEKAASKHGLGILRTFASVEKAGSKAFGGKSFASGIVSRLGAVKAAASAAGDGFGEAAISGGVLETAMGSLGVVAGATIGILAAAGYAAFKLADGWAKGAASIGRTSDVIGIATKQLQEFQAAGERAGVDRGASTSALGGIAQTLNDARYGRNQEALALMMRLGVKFRNGPDGQLDTAGMTLDLADAIARQKNAQTRRMIASKFGISDAALPMFLQGSGQLKADMADADKHAAILSDADVAKGKRIVRKGAIVGQMKDRAMMRAGEATAEGEEKLYDGIISGGRSIMDGGGQFAKSVHDEFAPAVTKLGRVIDRVVSRIEQPFSGARTRGIPSDIVRFFKSKGLDNAHAYGIAAGIVAESGGDDRAVNPKSGAVGLGQWLGSRKAKLFKLYGHDPSRMDQLENLWRELTGGDPGGKAVLEAAGVDEVLSAYVRKFMRPAPGSETTGDLMRGHRALGQAAEHPTTVKVEIEMRGAPKGTKAKVTAGRSSQPAVSHAFAF